MSLVNRLLGFALLILILINHATDVCAQPQGFNIDSFNASIRTLSSDTEKINTIIETEITFGCEDTLVKLQLIKEAKDLSQKINWYTGIYQSNRALSSVYINCYKNYQKVNEILLESAELAKRNSDIIAEAVAYEAVAKNYNRLSQTDKAIEYFGKALLLKPGSDLEIGILADIGHAYSIIGDFPNSIVYYDSSLKVIESKVAKNRSTDISDTVMRIGLKINMADIYMVMPNNVGKALSVYEDVLHISTLIKNKLFVILSLTGIGNSYKYEKQYAKALEYFQKGLDVCNNVNVFGELATPAHGGRHSETCSGLDVFDNLVIIYNQIANTYLDSGNFKMAKNYADSASDLADRQHDIKMLSKTNATLGKVYLKLSQPDLAISYLQKGLDHAKDLHDLADQKEAWYGLCSAFEMNHNYEKALDALRHYMNTRDSASNIEKTNQAMRKDLEIKYAREGAIKDSNYKKDIERVKLYTYGGYLGLAMVMLLAFFMYRSYKIQKKYNALLSKEKKGHLAHIEAQSHVLSDIAHIQAHEVRGPVSAILGFVQIYNFDDATDPNNKEIMQWIGVSAEKLDKVVRNVVTKENELRSEHEGDQPVADL